LREEAWVRAGGGDSGRDREDQGAGEVRGAGKLVVPALVLRAQRVLLRPLLRQLAVAAQSSHALARAVQQQLGAGQKARERLLEKAEVVGSPKGEGQANYQPVGFPHHDLRFHSPPLFLARIVFPLFFWGAQ